MLLGLEESDKCLLDVSDSCRTQDNSVTEIDPKSAQPVEAMGHLGCASVVGVSGQVSNAVVWDPESGFFAYVADNIVIIENLKTREQIFLNHHSQPLCGLALSHDGKLLATGSSGVEISKCADVCIWQVATGKMVSQLLYHPFGVQVIST